MTVTRARLGGDAAGIPSLSGNVKARLMPNELIFEIERHIRELEQWVLRQSELVEELEQAGWHEPARLARQVSATMTNSLNTLSWLSRKNGVMQ